MKKKIAVSLTAALTAAMLISGANAEPATQNVTPVQIASLIQANISSGNTAKAMELIAQLRSMGITNINIGNTVYSINYIQELVISNPEHASVLVAAIIQQPQGNTFIYNSPGQRVAVADLVSSKNLVKPAFTNSFLSNPFVSSNYSSDNFPTSSAG